MRTRSKWREHKQQSRKQNNHLVRLSDFSFCFQQREDRRSPEGDCEVSFPSHKVAAPTIPAQSHILPL